MGCKLIIVEPHFPMKLSAAFGFTSVWTTLRSSLKYTCNDKAIYVTDRLLFKSARVYFQLFASGKKLRIFLMMGKIHKKNHPLFMSPKTKRYLIYNIVEKAVSEI